ncbi:MAG: pyridoxamine 5'-phosphate oxidase family protein [Planctomycetes bacterium]|nr:pyridoxamine 5'-phosphate oxidase family protein [Planctomycetota bacterium]
MESENSGERKVQSAMGTSDRAQRFYERQMHDHLTERMISLIRQQEMVFVATADSHGNCDCSPRIGNAGFVLVLDEVTLAYPEYRGNGVYASLGNILENPHIGLVFLDFFATTVGLHVNGKAHSYANSEISPALKAYLEHNDPPLVTAVERWVVVTVEEAYIHCSKHIPLLAKMDKPIDWGTDDPVAKSNDFFMESPPQADSGNDTPER